MGGNDQIPLCGEGADEGKQGIARDVADAAFVEGLRGKQLLQQPGSFRRKLRLLQHNACNSPRIVSPAHPGKIIARARLCDTGNIALQLAKGKGKLAPLLPRRELKEFFRRDHQ